MSSVSTSPFPQERLETPRHFTPANLPPRLPYAPHHPPLVRRVTAAAEATSVSNTSSLISSSPASMHMPRSLPMSSPTNNPPRRRNRLLLRHRARTVTPPAYIDPALIPTRGTVWADYTAHRMPVMFDERVDWETPYHPSSHGAARARRRLHTRRRRVSRLTDFLAWRARRGVDGDDGENDSLGLTYEELLQLDDGNVKCGLSSDELVQLGCFDATKEHMEHDCHICLEAVDFGVPVVRLCCDHLFHRTCIHTWLKIKRTCPICRCEL